MTEFTAFEFATTTGTEGRSLPERLTEVKNVKDFGAVGDGVHDDWPNIMDAITEEGVSLTVTAPVYSGSIRLASLSWAGGVVTATTVGNHLLTTSDQVVIVNCFSSGGSAPGRYNGTFTVTVTNATTFTYAVALDPLAPGYLGCVRPLITGATWASNLMTIDYAAPHRYPGPTHTLNVAGLSAGTGSRVCTVTGAKQLTFPLTGSGAVTGMATATILPSPILTVASTAAATLSTDYLQEQYPVCPGAIYSHQITAKTATTITFGTLPFQHDFAISDVVRVQRVGKRKIYFPAGTYKITQTIPFSDSGGPNVVFCGVPGRSIIRGNFADYLFQTNMKNANTGIIKYEGLTFVNDHASGRGVQLCTVGGAVQDCIFDCNVGLNFASIDYLNSIAFSIHVSNCIFKATAAPTGSVGIISDINNANVEGCYFNGVAEGVRNQQFGQTYLGNRFENCATAAFVMAWTPIGTQGNNSIGSIRGTKIKNCGSGIWARGGVGNVRIKGNAIEGGAGASYGLRSNGSGGTVYGGVDVSGAFATMAVDINHGSEANKRMTAWSGIRAANSGAGGIWDLSSTALSMNLRECSTAQTHTFAQIMGRAIATATWSGGVATITTMSNHGWSGTFDVLIEGVTGVTGYNGRYTVLSGAGTNQFTFTLADPGGSGTAGTGTVITVTGLTGASTSRNVQESKTYNITDGALRGGGTAVTGNFVQGSGIQHIKVRWTTNGWVMAG